jgi:predicted Zn-dependent protease
MKWILLLWVALSMEAQTTVRYWTGPHERSVFAEWAMQAWAAGTDGKLKVEKVDRAEDADIRFRWVNPQRRGLYGQSYSVPGAGKPTADIVINPSIASLGPEMAAATDKDPLYGEVILFLTCVHEAGHALGPVHTRDFADIMYSFEFGGDFVGYFQRYRQKLKKREEMRNVSPLSDGDIRQIRDVALRLQQNEKR